MAIKDRFIHFLKNTPVASIVTLGSLFILILNGFDLLGATGLGFIEPAEGEEGSLWLTFFGLAFVFGLTMYALLAINALWMWVYKGRAFRRWRFQRAAKKLAALPDEQRAIVAAAIHNWSPRIEVERSALKHAVRLEHEGILRDLSPPSEEIAASRRYVVKRSIWEALLTDPDLVGDADAGRVVAERRDEPAAEAEAEAEADAQDQALDSDAAQAAESDSATDAKSERASTPGSPLSQANQSAKLRSGSISVRMADTAIGSRPMGTPAPSSPPSAKPADPMAPSLEDDDDDAPNAS